MITLLSTLISFLMGGLPKILEFFQDKSDKAHELQLAQMQTERELQMLERGFAAQVRVEEIRTDQVAMQTAVQERSTVCTRYSHRQRCIAVGYESACLCKANHHIWYVHDASVCEHLWLLLRMEDWCAF